MINIVSYCQGSQEPPCRLGFASFGCALGWRGGTALSSYSANLFNSSSTTSGFFYQLKVILLIAAFSMLRIEMESNLNMEVIFKKLLN